MFIYWSCAGINTSQRYLKIFKSEYPISNKECPMMKFSFDIRYSLFDILRFKKTI